MRLWHVGVIVRDLDEALKFYRAIPGAEDEWVVNRGMVFDAEATKVGEPATFDTAVGKVGGIGYELIQPVSNYSYQMETLKEKGEHIDHMAYIAGDEQDKIVDALLAQGHTRVWEVQAGPVHVVFVKAKDGGMTYEIVNVCPDEL